MKSVEDYHKGFRDGMSANQKHPQTLMIMNYNLNQIIELICKNEEREKMATVLIKRKEAEAKLAKLGVPRDLGGRYHILDVLEALGLIVIEEEAIVIDHVDKRPVIIKRNGKVVYTELPD